MARTYSEMIELETEAPPFNLPAANPDVDDRGEATRSLDDYDDARALVIVFMCNHCPYVKTVEDRLIELARSVRDRGVYFIGISSNDAEAYPEDSFESMAERAREKSYPFPYLYDEFQDVARAYGAVCTPDIFLYDGDHHLIYRGRLDDGRPGMEPTTTDLRDAIEEYLDTGAVTVEQIPSMGCNIKWKAA